MLHLTQLIFGPFFVVLISTLALIGLQTPYVLAQETNMTGGMAAELYGNATAAPHKDEFYVRDS